MRRRLTALLSVTALLVAGCSSFEAKQREWIFNPTTATWATGKDVTAGMDDVWIDRAPVDADELDGPDTSVRLHALWLPQPNADAPVLLYLHGARWDLRGSAFRMRRMHQLGFAVLGVDYRGFGQSTPGLPSEASALADAHAAWRWLAEQQPAAPRYVFGHSLGGAIAVSLAAEVPDAAGLIVEGTFTSIPDVFATMQWGWLPVSALITQRFDAASRITQVKAPVLVVHGSADQLIQPALGRALFDKANAPKRFVLVEGGSHHNTNSIGQAQYRAALNELFGLPAL